MKHTKSYNIDDQLLERIISVAYGSAGFFEKREIEKLARQNPEIKELLEEYKSTANSLHSVELENCPEEILKNVEGIINPGREEKSSIFIDIYTVFVGKPLVSAAAATLLIVILLFSTVIEREKFDDSFTSSEVVAAHEQVKQSLAMIGKIFNKTTNTLENEILGTRVGKPINTGIKKVNNLFDKENKNDTLN